MSKSSVDRNLADERYIRKKVKENFPPEYFEAYRVWKDGLPVGLWASRESIPKGHYGILDTAALTGAISKKI